MQTTGHRAAPDHGLGPPVQRLRLPLATAGDVRRELARLYRESRAGHVVVPDASRLANSLQILGELHRNIGPGAAHRKTGGTGMHKALNRRLDALEQQHEPEARLPTVVADNTPQAELDVMRAADIEVYRLREFVEIAV